MLYEAQRRGTKKDIEREDTSNLWAVTDVGMGKHLKAVGGKIVCDGACKAPRRSK
jgi:hypothetical protein